MKDYGTIKSLLHFDDDLQDEVSSETWEFVNEAECVTRWQDNLGTNIFPKFGDKIVRFSGNNESYISSTNASGIFKLNRPEDYEFEAFICYTGYIQSVIYADIGEGKSITKAGNIFAIGDLVLAINSSAQFTLLGQTSTATITYEWQHVLLRLSNGTAKVFLDGEEILSTTYDTEHYIPNPLKVGGYEGVMDEFVFRHSNGATPPVIPTSAYDEITIRTTTIENGILNLSGVIQLRGGTAAVLASENPLLSRREIMCEVDTGKIKIGDGVNNWNDLPYAGGDNSSSIEFPASDDNAYVIKNGSFVPVVQVAAPSEWEPTIDTVEPLVLTVDEDMEIYQLTGTNVEVSE